MCFMDSGASIASTGWWLEAVSAAPSPLPSAPTQLTTSDDGVFALADPDAAYSETEESLSLIHI